ncbi:MAG: ATP-binding cassette domain-containing protein [Nocardioides sp.]|nr:ATP-binding cassette domain-containing protein [Nocardioides sp.]
MDFDQPPVLRVYADPDRPPLREDAWPMTIPAVAQLVADGFEPAKGVTFLVGENGSGKSTIVEAVAEAYGLNPEGGSANSMHSTRASESPLGRTLRLDRGLGTGRWGFFLRAETMHGWYTYMEQNREGLRQLPRNEVDYHELSHGESFLAVLRTRFDSPGFYCLDEPEAALSFMSTMGLISTLDGVVQSGGQVLCATHSPVLAAMPGAKILEVGEWGLREVEWADLELVRHWRAYLDAPRRYLRHILD